MMSVNYEELTPEEDMLVQCLKQYQIPEDLNTVGSCMTSREIEALRHARENSNPVKDIPAMPEKQSFPNNDDRPLETVVRELKQVICNALETIRSDVDAVARSVSLSPEALQLESMGRMLQQMEQLMLDTAEMRDNVIQCIDAQQRLDAENAVRELVKKGFRFKRIRIDDLCFEVDDHRDIRCCSPSS